MSEQELQKSELPDKKSFSVESVILTVINIIFWSGILLVIYVLYDMNRGWNDVRDNVKGYRLEEFNRNAEQTSQRLDDLDSSFEAIQQRLDALEKHLSVE